MKMTDRQLSKKLLDELKALQLMPDAEIDTSDVDEIAIWKEAVRGAFYSGDIKQAGYDVRAIANWILSAARVANQSLSNLHLNKLVYFLVERALVERQLLLTPAKIEAWDHGPVFREIYHSVKGSEDRPVRTPIQKFSVAQRKMVEADEEFTTDDLAFFKEFFSEYGKLTASQLRAMSHLPGTPWDLVWNHKTRTNFGMEITPAVILTKASRSRLVDGRK